MVAPNRVLELRKRLFLTQEVLAFRCRVTVRTVVHWERGEKYPHTRNLKRLARALGVTVDELQLGERPGHGHPDDTKSGP